nr:RodZ domain-containing protein [Nocardioides perillae]
MVIDDFAVEPAADPVVGPELAAARTRLGLSVDQLAARTRIRPHVIESIEVDDFAPCGGDFYARGHLRTLARVLGVDVAPLLAAYDERYAHAPVDARRVFEAELATTPLGSIRGTRGGPDWSVLVAAFMTVVLAWSVVQLLLDSPPEVRQPAPTLRNGSGGLGGGPAQADPVDVVVSAVQGGATVEVRGGDGETVFSGDIAHGESRALEVVPPVQVRADDAGAVTARVDGDDKGRLGETGSPATQTYVVARGDG